MRGKTIEKDVFFDGGLTEDEASELVADLVARMPHVEKHSAHEFLN